MGVDERNYLLGRPSSSVAKKTDAAFKMSFARRSHLTSRSSGAIRCVSTVEVPGRRPESISARFTQTRNDSLRRTCDCHGPLLVSKVRNASGSQAEANEQPCPS